MSLRQTARETLRRLALWRKPDASTAMALAAIHPHPLAIIGRDGRLEVVNPSFAELTNRPPEDLIWGRYTYFIRNEVAQTIIRSMLKGQTQPQQAHLKTSNANLMGHFSPLMDDKGRVRGVLVEGIPDTINRYPYRDGPHPRPQSTADLLTLLEWFMGEAAPHPTHEHIHPVIYKCRHDPAYAGKMGLQGATEPDTGRALYALVRMLNPNNVLEVGVYNGASSLTIAQALHDNGGQGRLNSVEIDPDHAALARKHLAEAELSPYATIHEGSSQDAALVKTLPPSEFIFIDGDHSYEGAKRDFELFDPLLLSGGLMLYHDTIKIMALRRLMIEIGETGRYQTLTLASSDGDGITLLKKQP